MLRLSSWSRVSLGVFLGLSLLTCAACDDASGGSSSGADATSDTSKTDTTSSDDAADTAGGTDATTAGPKLYLNEIAAAGDPDDWIELYNPGDTAIDLAGWKFADSLSDPAKQVGFASGASVPAKGFLLITVTSGEQGFKLGSDEEVGLWDPQGNLSDSADWNEGDSPAGGSYGRSPDGGATWQTFSTATPGASNTP